MNFFDLLSISVNNLFRRKLRSSLTLLGIILGAVSVSITLAMGSAIKNNNQKILDTKGDLKIIEVSINDSINNSKSDSEKLYMDDKAINKLKKLDGVDGVWYQLFVNGCDIFATKSNKYLLESPIYGINMDNISKFGYELLEGAIPKQTALENKKYVQVLAGQYFEYNLINDKIKGNNWSSKKNRWRNSPTYKYDAEKYGYDDDYVYKPPFVKYGEDIMRVAYQLPSTDNDSSSEPSFVDAITGKSDLYSEKSVKKNKYKYYNLNVTGRLSWDKVKDSDDWQLQNNAGSALFVNIDLAKDMIKEYRSINHKSTIYDDPSTKKPLFTYDDVKVKVKDIDLVQDITTKISKLDFEPKNKIEEVKKEQSRTKSNQLVLGVLGAITLFVASLSVANTMITSMYERTKEIGVMKVIGCKIGNIQLIFLLESAILGLIGGAIGMTITYYLSNFMNNITDVADSGNLTGIAKLLSTYMNMMKYDEYSAVKLDIALVNTNLWLYVIIGSILVTVVAGYIPSRRASKISALTAIKDE